MAGIDNNTLLYLRGDSLVDLSLNKKSLTNNGITVASDKSLYCNSGKYITVPNIGFTGSGDFTVEFYLKISKFGTSFYPFRTANYDVVGGISIEINVNKLLQVYITGNGNYSSKIIKYDITNYLNTYIHFAFCRKNGIGYMYINGIKVGESNLFNHSFTQNTATLFANENSTANIKHLRVSNIARYSSNFTPPTKPYNSIDINITNQTEDKIDFNVSKLGQETINKVEVLVNNALSKTYDIIGDLTCNIDKSLLLNSNNKIKIKVTFDNDYTEEKEIDYEYKIDKLSTSSSLKDLIGRQELLTNVIETQKNNLKSILESKNVEVAEEENKLSILIQKVDELANGKLWLYKDGDECIDITGGWGLNGYLGAGDEKKPIKNSDNMQLVAGTGQTVITGTNNKINLTNYSKIMVNVTVNKNASGFALNLLTSKDIASSSNWGDVSYLNMTSLNTGNHELELNITNINTSVYLGFFAWYTSSDILIHKIWLEK